MILCLIYYVNSLKPCVISGGENTIGNYESIVIQLYDEFKDRAVRDFNNLFLRARQIRQIM